MDLITLEANNMVDCLVAGKTSDIAGLYKYPAAVYFGDDVIVMNDEEEFVFALDTYRSILMQRGLAVVETTIVDRPQVDLDRFVVTVENRYLDLKGSHIGTAKIRYFLQREENNCLKIRLVEYLDWPCKTDIKKDRTFAIIRDQRAPRHRFSPQPTSHGPQSLH